MSQHRGGLQGTEEMNKVEAQLKGLPWTDFSDIPESIRFLYKLILVCNPMAGAVVRETQSYEMCCEYWFNNLKEEAKGGKT